MAKPSSSQRESKGKEPRAAQSSVNSPSTAAGAKGTVADKPGNDKTTKDQRANGQSKGLDAVALLEADHRKVESLFEEFENAAQEDEKERLATAICKELILHTMLEEQIFYAACRSEGIESALLDEAQVEHDGAKVLIGDLLTQPPSGEFFEAKVKVLSEYVKHHVAEEEKPDEGIFAKAREAQMDLPGLGRQLEACKSELLRRPERALLQPPRTRAVHVASNSPSQDDEMPRSNERERDEYRRFESDDEGRGRGRGWQEDPQGHSRASREGWGERSGGYNRGDKGEGRRYGRGRGNEEFDDRIQQPLESGRDWGEDPGQERDQPRYGSRGRYQQYEESSGRPDWERGQEREDESGRFTQRTDEDWQQDQVTRNYRSLRDDYEDERATGRGGRPEAARAPRDEGRGWYGDSEGHSQAARRGREEGGSRGRSRQQEDNGGNGHRGGGRQAQGGRSQSGSSSARQSHGQHGGWFGDSKGHSAAARRGHGGR